MNVVPHKLTDLEQLRRRIAKEHDAKQRDRWRAVLLALEGKPTAKIMDKLRRSKNFVQRWVYFYRDYGLDRLHPLKQPGKPPRLPRHQHQAFLDRINSSDRILRGQDIVQLLQTEFGVVYSLNGAYDLLHNLDYEPLRPRPVNPRKDSQQEQAWKQSAPLLSKPCENRTRTRGSKYGSRMSAASDKKDV